MTDFRIGVVGIPGKWSTEALADALEERTGFRLVIDMESVELDLENMRLEYDWRDLCELDALVVKKISQEYSPSTLDRLELLRVAEGSGVAVFSGAENMLRLVDRLSCTITLRNAGIPMPDTCVTEDIDAAMGVVEKYGSAVFKPLFSTKARGMCIIETDEDERKLRRQISQFRAENPVMYIQRKIDLSGQDLGLVFVGGQYLCTYARVSQGDTWNTTINSGGKYQPFEPPTDLIELAKRAQQPFDLDFTTVDIALTEDGPVVFEVSAFGGFRGALEGSGVDAAAAYADHVLKELEVT